MSPAGGPALSVVVPTVDEARCLGALLDQLAAQQGLALECIVSDGGSTDGTVEFARRAGARVTVGPPGRGRQLNAGCQLARADWVLVLHADSVLLRTDQLQRCLEFAERSLGPRDAGHFALRFVDAAAMGLDMGFFEAKSALGRPETTHGDQGLLLRAQTLADLGGYSDALPFLEDQELGQRLHRAGGRYVRLPGRLGTSARRFGTEGQVRRSIQNALLLTLFHAELAHLIPRLRAHYPPPHSVESPGTRALLLALHRTLAEQAPPEQARTWRQLAVQWRRLGLRTLAFGMDHRRHGPEAAVLHPVLDLWEARCEHRLDRPRLDRAAARLVRGVVTLGARLPRPTAPPSPEPPAPEPPAP